MNETKQTLAKSLRKNSTDAEIYLWQCLLNRQLVRFKFRRQHTIDPFIANFVCLHTKLIIELNGGQHYFRLTLSLSKKKLCVLK